MPDRGKKPEADGQSVPSRGEDEKPKDSSFRMLQERGISLSHVLDSIQDGISILDSDLNILFVNKTMENWYPSKGHFLGKKCHEVFNERTIPCEICPSLRTIQRGEADFDTVPLIRSGSIIGWLELFSFPMVNEETGKVEGIIEYVRDISKRKLAEGLLNESEEKHRALLNAIPDMLFRLDRKGVFLDFKPSKSVETYMEPESFLGESIRDIMPKDVAETALVHLTRAFETGEVQTFDYRLPIADETRDYEARLVVSGPDEVIALIRDITEHRAIEEQFRHTQKMEALGTLTGGIAHEFNNIITSIMGFGELLQEGIPKDSQLRNYIDVILTSADRAGRLTEGLLAYSRRQVTHMGHVDLNALVTGLDKLISTLVGENIELRMATCKVALNVMADPSQIEQVLINLSSNAVAAMPNGGILNIRSELVTSEGELAAYKGLIPPGHYAVLSVSDTGTGIPKVIQNKVFEPFFTTKDIGKGTGLGLAVVYGIIRKHKGYIHLESVPEEGSTFRIYLPLDDKEIPDKQQPSPVPPPEGKETILLAEDEPMVCAFLKKVLETSGYLVIEAADGIEAVERFREHPADIDLMILDLGMPRMNGYEAYLEIRSTAPGARVIFISGYPSGDDRIEHVRQAGIPFIQKPIKRDDFLHRIREMLESG